MGVQEIHILWSMMQAKIAGINELISHYSSNYTKCQDGSNGLILKCDAEES